MINGGAKDGPANPSEKELAKQNLIDRIERMFAEDDRNRPSAPRPNSFLLRSRWTPMENPAGERSGWSPPAGLQPAALLRRSGARSGPQADEDHAAPGARQGVSGPAQAAEGRRGDPRYRALHDERPDRRRRGEPVSFPGQQGQRLVISAKARDLVPYVADGVPGWFQAVLRLYDAGGKELATTTISAPTPTR